MDHTGDPQFWTADLYLVTGPAANTAGQVTIYDGIQWGWVNDLPEPSTFVLISLGTFGLFIHVVRFRKAAERAATD